MTDRKIITCNNNMAKRWVLAEVAAVFVKDVILRHRPLLLETHEGANTNHMHLALGTSLTEFNQRISVTSNLHQAVDKLDCFIFWHGDASHWHGLKAIVEKLNCDLGKQNGRSAKSLETLQEVPKRLSLLTLKISISLTCQSSVAGASLQTNPKIPKSQNCNLLFPSHPFFPSLAEGVIYWHLGQTAPNLSKTIKLRMVWLVAVQNLWIRDLRNPRNPIKRISQETSTDDLSLIKSLSALDEKKKNKPLDTESFPNSSKF